jgi:hypothetical protein
MRENVGVLEAVLYDRHVIFAYSNSNQSRVDI